MDKAITKTEIQDKVRDLVRRACEYESGGWLMLEIDSDGQFHVIASLDETHRYTVEGSNRVVLYSIKGCHGQDDLDDALCYADNEEEVDEITDDLAVNTADYACGGEEGGEKLGVTLSDDVIDWDELATELADIGVEVREM